LSPSDCALLLKESYPNVLNTLPKEQSVLPKEQLKINLTPWRKLFYSYLVAYLCKDLFDTCNQMHIDLVLDKRKRLTVDVAILLLVVISAIITVNSLAYFNNNRFHLFFQDLIDGKAHLEIKQDAICIVRDYPVYPNPLKNHTWSIHMTNAILFLACLIIFVVGTVFLGREAYYLRKK
jgi:hypothetical protein